MRPNLPLEVLALMAPLLSWVEGMEELRVPEAWLHGRLRPEDRERKWLIRELPTYSYDNVDDLVRLARGAPAVPARPPGGHGAPPEYRLTRPADYDLGRVFAELAERYFRWRGVELTVRAGRMEELHELALRFPVAHLVRHAHARAVSQGSLSTGRAVMLPEQLGLLHTAADGMRAVVDRGVAEGHLHLWGVPGAGETWADQLLRRLTPGLLAGHRTHERRLLFLSRAAVRLLGLALLYRAAGSRAPLPFSLLGLLDRAFQAQGPQEETACLAELRRRLRHEFSGLRSGGGLPAPPPGWEWALRIADSTADRLRRAGSAAAAEGIVDRVRAVERLHLEAHRWLAEPPPPAGGDAPETVLRDFFEQAFFRYLVFQTQHWQLGTQSGRTTGLRQFKQFYDSGTREYLGGKDQLEVQGLIMEQLRAARSIRQVEGRVTPPPAGPADLVPWLLGYAEGVRRNELDRFGLIIHFLKAAKDEESSRRESPSRRVVRYGRIRRETRTRAHRLYRILSSRHPAVAFIVGIDAANLELTTPPEVFAPAFRFLRDLPIEPRGPAWRWERGREAEQIHELLEKRALGLTYHVGEDFRHLLSGLRAIDEVMEFLGTRPGDRLGHAIALAMDPAVWAAQTGFQAVLPRQEWLDDLVWARQLLGAGHDTVGELEVEDRIQRLSRQVYGASRLTEDVEERVRRLVGMDVAADPDAGTGAAGAEQDWSPPALHDAWRLRQLDPYSIDVLGLSRGGVTVLPEPGGDEARRRWDAVQQRVLERVNREVGSRTAFHLLGLYWYHPAVREAGQALEVVDMQAQRDLWIKLLRDVQEKVRARVQRHQLVVEVNPSSNRVIGPMAALGEHPIFEMTLDRDRRLARNLRVTVNTDDPGVFSTSLPHEYYLLGETLLARGVPEPDVENWLEWLRRNGHDTSFLRSLPSGRDPRLRGLLRALERAYPRVRARLRRSDPLTDFWRRARRRARRERSEAEAERRRPVPSPPAAG